MTAEAFLKYLNFRCVWELWTALRSTPLVLALLGYAAYYWGKYIRRDKTETANRLSLVFPVGYEHVSSQLLTPYSRDRYWWGPCFDKEVGPRGFIKLRGAAYFGIRNIFPAILEMREWDINARGTCGTAALVWAAVGGHEDGVKLLLRQKYIDLDTAGTQYGLTLLSWAAESGHEGVVKLPLERKDVRVANTQCDLTACLWAAERGREGIIKLLLGREDINPNTLDTEFHWIQLGRVFWAGHVEILKSLLKRENINPKIADTKHGSTPLAWAATGGHYEVVKLLLE